MMRELRMRRWRNTATSVPKAPKNLGGDGMGSTGMREPDMYVLRCHVAPTAVDRVPNTARSGHGLHVPTAARCTCAIRVSCACAPDLVPGAPVHRDACTKHVAGRMSSGVSMRCKSVRCAE